MESLPHLDKEPETELEWFDALLRLARFLRSPQGCPWDRKQTTASFARYVGEEAEELREAVAEEENGHIEEEYGDVLFCLLMMAATAEDEGRFKLREAFARAHAKMIRRHGHIFGGREVSSVDDIVRVWEEIKAEERQKPQ
ncbi:MAG TPA: MazG nucleotide pyrophosphohydrolase domain-containing protein [Candidatus Hydrogenedentes bacterium]|nr:MazG nucleotide pyrophosphohydrolase domain-containing protein [Candidatus Hydrogenedentota bacterium]HPG65212.1 MazG nucleotide pyrophosphohydrolase domain-containing protein [Candidatus Hydrogenedentota bacterium]